MSMLIYIWFINVLLFLLHLFLRAEHEVTFWGHLEAPFFLINIICGVVTFLAYIIALIMRDYKEGKRRKRNEPIVLVESAVVDRRNMIITVLIVVVVILFILWKVG